MPSLPLLDETVDNSPHVVILGAGASIANYKYSGKKGKELPSMANIINILDLENELLNYGFVTKDLNFESFYDQISDKKEFDDLRKNIENRIYNYFSSLKIDESVTIYDYLVLSLRKKDLIATFNWDPLLLQAYLRNSRIKKLPQICFLHGNVLVGVCEEDHISGIMNNRCSKCGKFLKPSKLLYPVAHKDYNNDSFIKNEWERFKCYLNNAYFITVYGYSAPITDYEARKIMIEEWKSNSRLELAEIEIIDI